MTVEISLGGYSGLLTTLNEYAGLLSSATAIFSIIIAILVFCSQKKHNQLSVRPIANIGFADYENRIAVKIWNNGTGPLVLKKTSFFSTTNGAESDSFDDLIDAMPSLPEGFLWTDYCRVYEGRAISPNNAITLIELSDDSLDSDRSGLRDQCRKRLAQLTAIVEYTDIYGKSSFSCSRDLKWFGRH